MGSDNSVTGVGWRVDNFTISTRVCCTNNCTPPVITAPTVTQPTCTTPTGTIVVNATGNGTLEYSVDNGATYQASATFSGLVTGNYNIKVRLQASPTCESAYTSNPVVINPAPPAPVATLSAVPAVVCNGGVTKIYLNVSGGTGPFTVTIQTSQGQSTTRTMNNGDFVELGPISTGILNVFISSGTDANGCSLDVTNSNVTVTGIANPTAVATPSSQTSCSGSPIATIVLSGTGTVYNWTRDNTATVTGITASGAGDISGTLTNTTAAPVTVTFTITPTANGCEGTAITATVTVYPSPVITAPTVTQPTCLVPTGTIVVNATGSGTLEYSVDNGSTYQASATFSGLATGNYNIKVRLQSSPSCEAAYANNPVVITAATGCCVPPVITSPTVTQPTCLVPTGTIVVNATGNSPLEYSVDNGASWQPSATFSGLAPSNYYIISARHISNPTCASTYDRNPVVIHAPELPVVVIQADGPVTFCAGGSVNLSAVVAFPNYLRMVSPYNIDFSIGTAVFGPSIITTPLNGDFVYIPDGTASYLGCNPYAPGSLNGKIALIDRGICPFVYKAKNAQDAGAIGVVIVNNVAGGPLNMGSSDPSVIITIPLISVSQLDGAILKNMIAQGTTNGNTLQHTYSNYLWSNGATTTTINVTQSGTYTVQATDENGCIGTSLPLEVIVNPVPDVVATPSSQSICTGSAITAIVLSGAVPGTVFNWTRDNTVDVTGIAAIGAGDISGTLTNNTAAPVTVTFTITPSYTNAEVTCEGTPITATVTVNPVNYIACPGNMVETITNQNIPCFKAVNTPNPVFCGTLTRLTWKLTGATVLSSPTSGINYLGLRNMNVGTTTVKYTATFTGNIVRTCSFTVLVIETVPPQIYCPLDKNVTTTAGKCYKTGPVSLGTPVVSDNCGIVSVTNNA
ncbi:MAG: PKD-like domain-containing protein, partial [Ferruginibacter sp.]